MSMMIPKLCCSGSRANRSAGGPAGCPLRGRGWGTPAAAEGYRVVKQSQQAGVCTNSLVSSPDGCCERVRGRNHCLTCGAFGAASRGGGPVDGAALLAPAALDALTLHGRGREAACRAALAALAVTPSAAVIQGAVRTKRGAGLGRIVVLRAHPACAAVVGVVRAGGAGGARGGAGAGGGGAGRAGGAVLGGGGAGLEDVAGGAGGHLGGRLGAQDAAAHHLPMRSGGCTCGCMGCRGCMCAA
jgi:hypothetical protein